MRLFRRGTTDDTPQPAVQSDSPIWDALMAEHKRSGSAADLVAEVESGLRPETRAWFRQRRRHFDELASEPETEAGS